jgi:hypothetical protein
MIRLLAPPPPFFLCAVGRAYLREKGGRDTRSQIIRLRESLALYKSFSTLWFQWFQPSSQPPVETMQWLNHLPSSQSCWETSTSCIRNSDSESQHREGGEGGLWILAVVSQWGVGTHTVSHYLGSFCRTPSLRASSLGSTFFLAYITEGCEFCIPGRVKLCNSHGCFQLGLIHTFLCSRECCGW